MSRLSGMERESSHRSVMRETKPQIRPRNV